jgi:hypothetical protein
MEDRNGRTIWATTWLGGLCLLLIALMLALAPGRTGAEGGITLFVYVPLDVPARALEKKLGASLSGVTVTVFGRYKDFEKAVERDHPDAVLSLRPVLEFRKLTPVLQAAAGGKASETYVAMTVGDVGGLAGKVVGAVDLMGRKETTSFYARLLAMPDLKITWVTKTEDLLPLLQFQTAHAVLLPQRSVAALRSKSQLDLRTGGLPPIEVGLPALAVTGPGGAVIREAVHKLPRDLNLMIGVDQWRAE